MADNKTDLGYLGVPFQYRLAHHFMDDKKFFRDMCDIIDTNMFTDVNIRRFVGTLKNYYELHEYVPSYDDIEIELRSKTNGNDIDIETIIELVKKIKNTSCEGHDSIKEKAHKFFKQQNLTKAWNKVGEILKIGDIDRYDECEELIRSALVSGNRDEIGIRLRDNLGEVLSEDYRNVIPTGIKGVDEALEGGLGRGELAVLIGPSSFGKTSMTTAIANHAASMGYKTLQIVFEDKEKQIQRKHIAKITNIESRNLSKPENINLAREIMNETDLFDENLIIKKFNTGEITPINLRNYIKRLTNTGFKPELIVVDYFECLTSSKNFKDQWTGEGHTMRALEALASDLDVALWVPTQGTKDSLNADIVTMDKAGGSFKKIQIAHIVISIARSMEDIENNIATIAVLKNRSGRSGSVMEGIYFNNGTCDVNTDNVQIYSNWSDYENVKGERKAEKNTNLIEEAKKRREEAKRKMEEENKN